MAKEASAGRIVAFCDGGSRGNPGPSGYGVWIESEAGAPLAELSEFLGIRTNNVAEYRGLLAALGWAAEHGAEALRVVSDSELMVKQIKGQYSVKSPDLKPLYEEAKRRIGKLDRFEMQHVLRGKNKEADRLANEAMDRGMGRGAKQPPNGAGSSTRAAGAAIGANASASAKTVAATLTSRSASVAQQRSLLSPAPGELPREVTGFVKNGVVHLVEGELPEGTFVRVLPARA